jgi:hypothetical protein
MRFESQFVAHELPDVFDRIELGALWWQRDEGDVGGHDERVRAMPSRLIELARFV